LAGEQRQDAQGRDQGGSSGLAGGPEHGVEQGVLVGRDLATLPKPPTELGDGTGLLS
jgi:hypothetical protein